MGYEVEINSTAKQINDEDVTTAGKKSIDLSCKIHCKCSLNVNYLIYLLNKQEQDHVWLISICCNDS